MGKFDALFSYRRFLIKDETERLIKNTSLLALRAVLQLQGHFGCRSVFGLRIRWKMRKYTFVGRLFFLLQLEMPVTAFLIAPETNRSKFHEVLPHNFLL